MLRNPQAPISAADWKRDQLLKRLGHYFARYPIVPRMAAALPASIKAADQVHRVNCFRFR
jgi:hypothetical protein